MIIKIIIGIKVQIISIKWFFNKFRFKNLLFIKSKIKKIVKVIIINIIIIVKLWNEIRLSE
jgi:hypothetical protein